MYDLTQVAAIKSTAEEIAFNLSKYFRVRFWKFFVSNEMGFLQRAE